MNPSLMLCHLEPLRHCSLGFGFSLELGAWNLKLRHFLLSLALVIPSIAIAAPALTPIALRCEYLDSPLGLDQPHPRLTWRVESPERGQKQTAYRILVASDEGGLKRERGDLWDSGKVTTDETVNIVYT